MPFLDEKIRQLKADIKEAKASWDAAQDQFDSTLDDSRQPQIQRQIDEAEAKWQQCEAELERLNEIKIRVSQQDNTDFPETNPYICQVISGKSSKKLAKEVHKRLADAGRCSMYPPVCIEDKEDIDEKTQCIILILDENTRPMVKNLVKRSKGNFEILAATQILEYIKNPPLGLLVHNFAKTDFERGFNSLLSYLSIYIDAHKTKFIQPDMRLASRHWNTLVSNIIRTQRNPDDIECIPILGPDIGQSVALDSSVELFREWIEDYDLVDTPELARLLQYLSIVKFGDLSTAKKEYIRYQGLKHTKLKDEKDPYHVLARLPFPIYLTTNQDDNLIWALKKHNRKPKVIPAPGETLYLTSREYLDQTSKYVATYQNPLVIYLFGRADNPDSVRLTEHEFIKHIREVSRGNLLMPAPISDRLEKASKLLFLGFQVHDLRFQTLLHTLIRLLSNSDKRHIAVHSHIPIRPNRSWQRVELYINEYIRSEAYIEVHIGEVSDFLLELEARFDLQMEAEKKHG